MTVVSEDVGLSNGDRCLRFGDTTPTYVRRGPLVTVVIQRYCPVNMGSEWVRRAQKGSIGVHKGPGNWKGPRGSKNGSEWIRRRLKGPKGVKTGRVDTTNLVRCSEVVSVVVNQVVGIGVGGRL